jgi:hypothetical protein
MPHRRAGDNCNAYKRVSFPMTTLLRPGKIMEARVPARGRRFTVALRMAHLLL